MAATYRIGIDGGATKTEGILLDETGTVVARHRGPGCNPNVAGLEGARRAVMDVLDALTRTKVEEKSAISHTHIYAAGSRAFWQQVATTLSGFGHVFTADDSHPVLELATNGEAGLVLHSGTGSFVAARSRDATVHYAGGMGWRIGDPGSGYDIGRRAIARAVMELQGWSPPSALPAVVSTHFQLGERVTAAVLTRHCYAQPEMNREIAGLAPAVMQRVEAGDGTALELVVESAGDLLALANRVAGKLFGDEALPRVRAGLSGTILTNPRVAAALARRSPLVLAPVAGHPIEGVRRLVARA